MARLYTKLRRDLVVSRWQLLAVAAAVMLGIGFFHGSLVSYANLSRSYDLTYRRLAFGDVWVRTAPAPDDLVRRAARLPGVRTALGRIVSEIRVAQRDRPVRGVLGRIISLPAQHQPAINRVRVVSGHYFSAQGGREALLEVSFARAHNYRVGEFIYPTIRGEEIRFRVVGMVQSPEYLYSIQSKQYLVPTPNTFGVIFIPQREAEALLEMSGLVNEICVATAPGQRKAVARALKRLTDRYGGEEPITRDEQPSNKLLMMDLAGYGQMAVIFPVLFLTGAALSTYTLLARMVQAQQPQIGVLRAAGFGQRAVLAHFLWFAVAPGVMGGGMGVGLGYLFARLITHLYGELLAVPFIFFEPHLELAGAAMGLAAVTCLVAALAPARAAARLRPALAMREQPTQAMPLGSSLRWLGRGLPTGLRLPLRNLVRRPRRAAYTVLGVALGVSLVIVSVGMLDSVDDAIQTYFQEIERYDLTGGFDHAQPGRVISQVQSWPGVWRAEPTLDIPVELERRGVTHSTVLSALPPDGQLRHLTTESGRRVAPGPGEVLLGSLLREKFGVREGDALQVNYAQNRREFKISRTARVGPAISQPIGSSVYMRSDEVQRLFADRLGYPARAATGVLVRADPARIEWLRRRLHRLSAVAAVETRAQIHQQIADLMRFSEVFTGIMAMFGVGLALAVVFTAVSINVLERSRELATLRTLGFGLRRIAWFTTVENLLIAAAGVAIGLPLGRWLDAYMISTFQSESMSLEPVIYLRTYLIAALGVTALTAISQIPSLLRVRRMNLAAATKEIAG